MRRGLLLLAALTVVLGASPAVAAAAERFAAPNGIGPEGSCPAANPCSFQNAVAGVSVMDGDQVVLLPGSTAGVYEDQTAFFQVDNAITIHSRPSDPVPTVPLSNGFGLFATSSGVVVRRLVLQATGTALWLNNGGTAEQVYARSSGLNSTACVIGYPAVLIRDSVCHQTNGGQAFAFSVGGDVTESATLRNVTSVAVGAGSQGILVNAAAVGPGGDGARLTLDAKNVIASGEAADVVATTDGSNLATAVINLANSNYDQATASGSGASVTPAGTNGNQTQAPVFVDALMGDFHQLASSPTIDAGTASASLLGTLDLDGQARVQGCVPDIGADEFPATCPSPPLDGANPACARLARKLQRLKRKLKRLRNRSAPRRKVTQVKRKIRKTKKSLRKLGC